MSNINITEATIALIDSLKSTTGAFGLAGTGSEYKIVTDTNDVIIDQMAFSVAVRIKYI